MPEVPRLGPSDREVTQCEPHAGRSGSAAKPFASALTSQRMEIRAAALVTTVSAQRWLSKAKGRLGLGACGIVVGCASISHWVSRDATLEPVRNGRASNAPALAGSLDAAEARHILDRFAFGPRPGETEALE